MTKGKLARDAREEAVILYSKPAEDITTVCRNYFDKNNSCYYNEVVSGFISCDSGDLDECKMYIYHNVVGNGGADGRDTLTVAEFRKIFGEKALRPFVKKWESWQ